MSSDFTHLHLHTQYSFLDGAIRIKDLIQRVNQLGMKQVAVTDHGNMFGAIDFLMQAKAGGIKPILGMEAYVTEKARYTEKVRENFHLVLLAENNVGYDNLKKLSSQSFLQGKFYYPRIDKQLLYEHREGLIALTACLGGEVGKKCAKGDLDGARKAALEFKSIFGPSHFFLEVQPNGLPIQNKVNADLAMLAKENGLKLIATNDCHYVTRDQHDAQNILMAIRQQKAWDDPTLHKHETDAFYIRSGQEMWDLLQSDYADAFEMACEVGKRCNVNLDLGKTYLPAFPFPSEYKDEADYLQHIATKGLLKRFEEMSYLVDREQYVARLNSELSVIIRMGFSGYFLIVQDFINWAKQQLIRVGPGRGSGAGSLVAYALRITDIDPIPYNLLFERFLNPERISMPDFDIDFMQERRHEVIEYVANKYGRNRVGQIATYAALNPKSAIKDVARTLHIPFAEINELTKPMPLLIDGKKPDLDLALEYAPQLKKKAQEDKTYARTLNIARTLEGLYRQAGMHAAGIVIGAQDLWEYVPVFLGQNGELVTQFDKDKVETAGLVKFDFLGLKTLDVISCVERLVNERIVLENQLPPEQKCKAAQKHPHLKSKTLDNAEPIPPLAVDLLPPDEPRVYELLSSGDTLGVFQLESSGFQELCRKLKPDCFEDIIAAGALYRPGPMQSGMVEDFIDRKHGKKKVEYPHPLLESILKPTYGTFVYQEQVLLAAQVLAGYTLGTADLLRRAMGKKKFEEMQKQRQQFIDGSQQNGIAPAKAGHIFDSIEKFAGYGFNKSHSAAYAMITYQTAYLKRFYPIEFLVSLLSTANGNTGDIVKYAHEARSNGIVLLPPDINQSNKDFSVDYRVPHPPTQKTKSQSVYGCIRFGLGAVKGIGDTALDTILESRKQIGHFQNLTHFCESVNLQKVNKKALEALVKSGSMDGFQKSRRQLWLSLEKAVAHAQSNKKDRIAGQTSLFAMLEPAPCVAVPTEKEENKEWPQKEKLLYEREALGFYFSAHPLDRYIPDAKKMGCVFLSDVSSIRPHETVEVMAIVTELKSRMHKGGRGRWAIARIEDHLGQMELLCFSKQFQELEPILASKEPLWITAKVLVDDFGEENQETAVKLRLENAQLLTAIHEERTRIVEIWVCLQKKSTSLDVLEQIHQVCMRYPGNKTIQFHLDIENEYQVSFKTTPKTSVTPSEAFLSELESIREVTRVIRI